MPAKQQILYLWLAEGALDTETVGWAFHDGACGKGPSLPSSEPPYATGLKAMEDGWFLIQSPAPVTLAPQAEHEVSYLANEFIFEKRVDA